MIALMIVHKRQLTREASESYVFYLLDYPKGKLVPKISQVSSRGFVYVEHGSHIFREERHLMLPLSQCTSSVGSVVS